jgi:hypothetical protein
MVRAMQHLQTSTLSFVMHRPEDEMRIVDAYHGTDASAAQEIVARQQIVPSKNGYDWLGHGAYFW